MYINEMVEQVKPVGICVEAVLRHNNKMGFTQNKLCDLYE